MKTHLPSLKSLCLFLLLWAPVILIAQTDPTPVTLPFTLTSQTGNTLPAGVAIHKFGSIQTTRTTSAGTADLGYNSGTATTNSGAWYGLGADCIGLLCSGTNAAGAIIVSINTTGLTNVTVAWQCKSVFLQNSRDNSVALQYRIGTTGSFTDVGTTTTYTSNGKLLNDESAILSEILPAAAENQAEVQVRWIYWESAGTTGSRDKIAVKNISISGGTLPVKLTRFEGAMTKDKTVALSWTTAQEINNSHFEIERSPNGKDFTVIGKVTGNGNHNGILNYTYTDINPSLNTTNYYRLKQVDFDGQYEHSNIITITGTTVLAADMSLYPNPVKHEQSTLKYTLSAASDISVMIFNNMGEQVYAVTEKNRDAGAYYSVLPSLTEGMYTIKIVAGQDIQTLRLLAQ